MSSLPLLIACSPSLNSFAWPLLFPLPLPSPPAQSQHIILLIQPTDSSESRTYLDFSSPAQAWDAVVRLFEERLRAMTPVVGKLTYDVQQLFLYLDNLADLSCMMCVECLQHPPGWHLLPARAEGAPPPSLPHACNGHFTARTQNTHTHPFAPYHLCRACSRDRSAGGDKVSYNAHPKDYIKQNVLAHLQRQAGGGGGGGGSGGGRRH